MEEQNSIEYWKKMYKAKQEELDGVLFKYKSLENEWEARLQYSRRGLEVTNRELAIKNSEITKINNELSALKKELEEKVEERTKNLQESKEELEEKIDRLERFHSITIGRELQMVNLKEKNKKLTRIIRKLIKKNKDLKSNNTETK